MIDPFAKNHYFCEAFDGTAELVTLTTTLWLVILIYLVCFLIGCRNIVEILIKQKYYRSVYLTL